MELLFESHVFASRFLSCLIVIAVWSTPCGINHQLISHPNALDELCPFAVVLIANLAGWNRNQVRSIGIYEPTVILLLSAIMGL